LTYLLVLSFLVHRVLPKGRIKKEGLILASVGALLAAPFAFAVSSCLNSAPNPSFRKDPVNEERENKEVGLGKLNASALPISGGEASLSDWGGFSHFPPFAGNGSV
jgi:hypothetical protein